MAQEFEPRRATAGQTFGYTDGNGKQKSFSADEDGVVHPKNAEEKAVLDAFALPVARKAMAAEPEKAAEPQKGGK